MHVLKFSTELQNSEISPATLLKSDSNKFHHREVILQAILKTTGALTETVFNIVIGGWIGQPKLLDCRPVTLENKGQFCKDVLEIFKISEDPFLFEDFKKIICRGAFSLVVGCSQYSCNCNKRVP